MIKATLAAGDVVHAWLRPVAAAARGTVAVTRAGSRPEHLIVEGPTRSPLFTAWTCPEGGEVTFAWDAAETDVTVLYAFAPGDVTETGIRTLWAAEAARLDDGRYALHAHSPFGWMNDPNGLCEAGGLTHLFYQHNPNRRRWDTMHWGHAVSRDGVRWTHLPVMLQPDPAIARAATNQGGAYSGTALPRPDGSLRLFFTERQDGKEVPRERQMTALSLDGVSAGPATPVLEGHPALPGYRDEWRDPYVFTGPDGGLKMLVGGADATDSLVLLYATDDPEGASDWRFVDVLHREPGKRGIPAECPCIIALDGEGAGLWVLIYGLIGSRDEATRRRNLTRTRIGTFDGRRFEPLHEHELDFGPDNYAAQVWRGRDGPLAIAWAANWTDVFADRDFPSAMTFPRRLLWRDGRLVTPPVEALATLRDGAPRAVGDGAVRLDEAGLAELELELEPGTPFTLLLDHPTHDIALVSDGAEIELRYEPPGHRSVPRYRTQAPGLSSVRLFIDVGSIEVFLDGGTACCTKRIDSAEPVRSLRLACDPVRIRQARLWRLSPA